MTDASRAGRSTLSVCCLTSDPPARVAAMLALFRGVADEIVVGVDSRVSAGLHPLLEVADTVARFEYVDPPERSRPWLFSLCRGDAVFSIDGDEVPSAALVRTLAPLAADTSVAQTRIARRWCFPDERFWLAERPWWPDLQQRLVRPGPLLDFDLAVHGGVRAALPVRLAEESVYHLVCITREVSDRRRRAREYEALRPGMVAVGGGPMNDTLYVPEHFATLRPVETPDEDVACLRAVLAATDGPSSPAYDLQIVPAAEVLAHVPQDALAEQGYRASVRMMERDLRTDPGHPTMLLAEVLNSGDLPIPHRDARGAQVRVATRVLDRRPGEPSSGWAMTMLPSDVPPREARLVEVHVNVPTTPGTYTVEMDLLNERGAWFGCATRFDLAVTTRWGRFTG
jgi:hypothetical protein